MTMFGAVVVARCIDDAVTGDNEPVLARGRFACGRCGALATNNPSERNRA